MKIVVLLGRSFYFGQFETACCLRAGDMIFPLPDYVCRGTGRGSSRAQKKAMAKAVVERKERRRRRYGIPKRVRAHPRPHENGDRVSLVIMVKAKKPRRKLKCNGDGGKKDRKSLLLYQLSKQKQERPRTNEDLQNRPHGNEVRHGEGDLTPPTRAADRGAISQQTTNTFGHSTCKRNKQA